MLLERYDGEPPHVAILGAGMLSSSIAQFVSYPLALVRTRLQVSQAQRSSAQLSSAAPTNNPVILPQQHTVAHVRPR